MLTAHAVAVEQDLEKAYGYQEALADLYPDSYVAHNNLGRIGHLLGRPLDAVASYRRALDLYPALGVAANGLYYVLAFELDRVDAALAVARSAVAADSANAQAWMQMGMALSAVDSLGTAARALARSVELRPAATENHYRLAHLYREQERHAEAESVLRGVLARDSTAQPARYDLGVVLAAAGREEEARARFRENLAHWSARGPEAESARPRYFTAALLARLGEDARARSALEGAVAADSSLHFERARVLALLGREEEAVRCLGRAADAGYGDFLRMKLHPDFEGLRSRPGFREIVERGLFGGGPLPGETAAPGEPARLSARGSGR